MAVRTADAEWKGSLAQGTGTLTTESGALSSPYSFQSRFEEGDGTNPEELLAAAHAGCYSMALSHALAEAGHAPESVHTTAHVTLDSEGEGFAITAIQLVCRARVPGLDGGTFLEHAEDAKVGCPVSKALASVEISLDAALQS
jgi:osmotically inducible protein OsmC